MKFILILLSILAVMGLLVLLIAYICFRMAFYSPDRDPKSLEIIETPDGKIYDPFRENMIKWTQEVRAMPHDSFTITSFDGLKLHAKYYEYAPGAPIELMFHGYRGTSEKDLSGGVQRCRKLGHSAFIVDQRGSRESEGNVISFGINERRDCLAWVDFMIHHFGPDVQIILCGISMGAATVMMAAGEPLPKNVIGVLADCGYSSIKEIIKNTIRKMGLPVELSYPVVKLGARLYGHFDLEEASPDEALTHATVPVIIFHGESDDLVPCEMGHICYEACASEKKLLVTVPGAGHGLSYPVDPQRYLGTLTEFFHSPIKVQ